MIIIYFSLLISVGLSTSLDASELMVVGKNFVIPATQQISFGPLIKTVSPEFIKNHVPKILDLSENQSAVKSQGQRGACTYFVISSLVESLIKKELNKNVDVSEEYIAWAAKVKKGMRSDEEGSSIAVNAATIQEFGFMLEKDLPYEQSWFDVGFPCEGKKSAPNINPICYSHSGPDSESSKHIIDGENFVFEVVGSSSLDLIKALSLRRNPVTVSILGHPKTWNTQTGELVLTKKMKEECQQKLVKCSGHVALIIGYDLNKKNFLLKNSWGEGWGNKGYGTISFDYIDEMSSRYFLTGYLKGNLEIPKNH
jgi:C1A family cysteine protease